MKRLKFLIVALGLIAAQGMFAVTLPTTSYKPASYVTDDNVSSGMNGNLFSGSFLRLGSGEIETACLEEFPPETDPTGVACSQCCSDTYASVCPSGSCADYDQDFEDCKTACVARSVPLDAPLWFMLALAALGAAFSVALRKRLA